ncbi:hypothetical protein ACFOLF_14805 [Paenibacillus sepulcri]|uniref:Haloacid dehalogenase n=1 Tax=Paenibacillus sepulcri TaxID=359917 RepID=A0ABS7BVN4_9BACL|nr:hypothetical protein [Paenibacillus sepulcri]
MSQSNVLSFDIWDTVIRRACHPDEIKLYVSRYIYLKFNRYLNTSYRDYYDIYFERCKLEGEIGSQSKLSGNDDEYMHSEVFRALLNQISDGTIPESEDVIGELIKIELEQEKYVTYLDSEIEDLIHSQQRKRIFFVSDFYSNKKFIEELLAHVGFKVEYSGGYVSSEVRLNKRSGKLFQYFHTEQSINADEHIHIGDSLIADVESPQKLGINTIHYFHEVEEKKRENNRIKFEQRMANKGFKINISKANESIVLQENSYKELNEIGRENGIIFFTFVMEIIEEAVKKGYSKIYYLTREGEFFKKIHDVILDNNLYGLKLPESEILEVSRVATFAPSIQNVTLEEFMRLWNQYSTQSMDAFFQSLNIDIKNFAQFLDDYSIDSKEEIQYPWLNLKIQSLFHDINFCDKLKEELEGKRSLLLKYFAEKGITKNTERIFLVDIGWRGTIQDNIANIFNETIVDGYYVGLYDFINKQPFNTTKTSFIAKEVMNSVLRFVSPFEMMCNSPSGSVVSYELNENHIKVKKVNDRAEDSVHMQFIKYFQDGVLSIGRELTHLVKNHALTSQDLKKQSVTTLQFLLQEPPKILTAAFFELAHNETFGLGKYVEKKVKFPYLLTLMAVVSKNHRRKLKQFIENSSWPQGLLIYKGLDLLNRYYNKHMSKLFQSTNGIINTGSSDLVNLQNEVEDQNRLLGERYSAMMEMEAMIKERDLTIKEQGKLLEERYNSMMEMEKLIKERDHLINVLEEKLRHKLNG